MLNHYETVFILTPVLSENQVKEAVNKFRNFLSNSEAEIVNDENWGLRKLAYKVNKKSTGFYQLFEYKINPLLIEKFETQLRRDERVMRFLTVKLDKHAIKFNQSRRQKAKEKIQGPKPVDELQ